VVPALFVVACAAIVANQIAADPRESAFGLLFVIAGVPIYYAWARLGAPLRQGEPGRAHH